MSGTSFVLYPAVGISSFLALFLLHLSQNLVNPVHSQV
jgi:hypothetical protein